VSDALKAHNEPPYNLVLLDLDGTMIDSEPGVQAAVRHALVTGFDITPTQAELEEFMGPPLADVLPRIFGLNDPADEKRFFELFCAVYFHGMEYDFDLYPGMLDLVNDLFDAGVSIALATSKPAESAERILQHANIDHRFTFIAGSASDGSRQNKTDVLAHAFTQMQANAATHRIVMVGDRALDLHAAHDHGVDSIAAYWGYAPLGELDDCAATHRVANVAELRKVLLPN
jgi:phosphoglycolate phosphatase